jgi:transmembrane sensor
MSTPRPSFRDLGERLAREQDVLLARPLPPDQATLRPVVRAKRPRRAAWIAGGIAAAFVAAVAVVLLVARARPLGVTVGGEVVAGGEWISAPPDAPLPIRFSEGTEIRLAPEARARVAEVTHNGAHLLLESGTAHVSVTPNRGGQWTFTAGPFQVDVKGTQFEIAWSPREQVFTLELVEGSVFISGCALGQGHPLFAGETLSASCLAHEFHIDSASSRGAKLAPPVPAATQPAPPPALSPSALPGLDPDESATRATPGAPPREPGGRAGDEPETWQTLGRASRFKEAFARVHERGFDSVLASADRDDLLLLGDVARLSGDSGSALLAYRRVRSRAPGTEAAANAVFAMGRIYFDQRGAYADAAQCFATYRRERSNGPLARDATGRQMEALARAGDAAAAARVAEEYLRKYPKGPHAAFARTLHPEPTEVRSPGP